MRSMAPRARAAIVGRDGHVVLVQRQRVAHAGQGDRLHEGAHGLGIGRDELLVGRHLPHPVHDPGLGGHDEPLGRPLGHRPDHPLGRGDVQPLRLDVAPSHAVDELPGAAALGMDQHLRFGILRPRLRSAPRRGSPCARGTRPSRPRSGGRAASGARGCQGRSRAGTGSPGRRGSRRSRRARCRWCSSSRARL